MPIDQAEAAIKAGRVSLRGKRATTPLALVSRTDEVRVDGQRVSLDAPTRALMLHKPAGAVTSKVDQEREPTVFDLLQTTLPAPLLSYEWHAIGRLDRDTTGLLLFTNDERLVAHVTRPESHLPKR